MLSSNPLKMCKNSPKKFWAEYTIKDALAQGYLATMTNVSDTHITGFIELTVYERVFLFKDVSLPFYRHKCA
jgi:hypothetical protein